MLRITIELVPHGVEADAHAIAECIIRNDLTHEDSPRRGNYVATICGEHQREATVRVLDFPRLDLGPWYLLHRVLDQMAVNESSSAPTLPAGEGEAQP